MSFIPLLKHILKCTDEEPEIKENISQQKSDKAVTSKQDKNKPDKNNEQIVEEEIQASNIQVSCFSRICTNISCVLEIFNKLYNLKFFFFK